MSIADQPELQLTLPRGKGTDANSKNLTTALSSSDAPQNLKFEREDWTSFRTIEGLQQKAGVAKQKLACLVLKELGDNGLDAGAEVKVGPLPSGNYYVEDDGPGIDGTPEEIGRLYSISRPMISTELLGLPTRGARFAGCRRGGARERRHADCYHAQSPHRASSRTRWLHDGHQRKEGQLPGRHPRRDQLWPCSCCQSFRHARMGASRLPVATSLASSFTHSQ